MNFSRILKASLLIAAIIFCSASAGFAVPTLQLDINGGTYYDSGSETIVTGADTFSVYAYGTPNGGTILGSLDPADGDPDAYGNVSAADILADTYYLSVALTPKTDVPVAAGSILVNGVDITGDMTYGNPPVDATANPELAPHGIFDTYYAEIAFQFTSLQTAKAYNTQDRAISGTDFATAFDPTGNDMFYMAFEVDISNLIDAYEVHFDLYSSAYKAVKDKGELVGFEIIRGQFAPFSHDAGTTVPEPATLVLLGSGLIGIGISRHRRK